MRPVTLSLISFILAMIFCIEFCFLGGARTRARGSCGSESEGEVGGSPQGQGKGSGRSDEDAKRREVFVRDINALLRFHFMTSPY